MPTPALQGLRRFGGHKGVLLRLHEHALELQVIRHEIEVTVTVPESVLEWFVNVKSLKTGSECSDWIDYQGYDNRSAVESEQEMCGDVTSFVTQLLARDLRYVEASESPSKRLEWLVDQEWQQAVPLTVRTLGTPAAYEEPITVYVQLLDEGVDVWRPVEATSLGDGLYRLKGRRPDEEVWVFDTGDVVRCRRQNLSDGEVLVAFERAG